MPYLHILYAPLVLRQNKQDKKLKCLNEVFSVGIIMHYVINAASAFYSPNALASFIDYGDYFYSENMTLGRFSGMAFSFTISTSYVQEKTSCKTQLNMPPAPTADSPMHSPLNTHFGAARSVLKCSITSNVRVAIRNTTVKPENQTRKISLSTTLLYFSSPSVSAAGLQPSTHSCKTSRRISIHISNTWMNIRAFLSHR